MPVSRLLSDEELADYEAATGRVIVEMLAAAESDAEATPAVLVASHGPFAWGDDVGAATENAIALEAVAAAAFRTFAIEPGAEPIQRGLLEKHHRRKHGSTAYYGQQR